MEGDIEENSHRDFPVAYYTRYANLTPVQFLNSFLKLISLILFLKKPQVMLYFFFSYPRITLEELKCAFTIL